MAEPLAEAIEAYLEQFRQDLAAIREGLLDIAQGKPHDLEGLRELVAQYTTAAHQAQEAERQFTHNTHEVIQARARLLKQHQQREQGHERDQHQSKTLGY